MTPGHPEAGQSRFPPPSVIGPTQPLPAKSESRRVMARPCAVCNAGPSAEAVLPENVLFVTRIVPTLKL